MDKKKLFGIRLFSILLIVVGAFSIVSLGFVQKGVIKSSANLLANVVWLVCGIGIFRLKTWAYKLLYTFSSIVVVVGLLVFIFSFFSFLGGSKDVHSLVLLQSFLYIMIYVLFIRFLHFPSVKNQFKDLGRF